MQLDDRVEQVPDSVPVLGSDLEHRIEARAGRTRCTGLRARRSSILLMASMAGFAAREHAWRSRGRRGTSPSRPSTTRTRRSASRWRAGPRSSTSACSGSSLAPNMPPVSVSSKCVPCHSTAARSRRASCPGMAVTIARRVPLRRLNSVDLPTFGRPTSTTEGRRFGHLWGDLAVFDSVSDSFYSSYSVSGRGVHA